MNDFNTGIYLLQIHLKDDDIIKTGALGKFKYNKGFYFYIGSAQNNLNSRIERHLSKDKKFYWHIDYLLDRAKIIEYVIFNAKKTFECSLFNNLKESDVFKVPIKGFGASDCTCISHLLYSKEKIDLSRHLRQVKQEYRIIKPGVKN
ncbi:MAG: GIY-YIG nuclease family protein [Halanaerobiales bacterium]|nr:GIY-YIG nuclease family protein [Halanaerobiales bacterium]